MTANPTTAQSTKTARRTVRVSPSTVAAARFRVHADERSGVDTPAVIVKIAQAEHRLSPASTP